MVVIDEIAKQYKMLSSSDRELLIELRNKLTFLNSHIDILVKQITLLENVAIESMRFSDEANEILSKFEKEFDR